jgi:hypothetical protein
MLVAQSNRPESLDGWKISAGEGHTVGMVAVELLPSTVGVLAKVLGLTD